MRTGELALVATAGLVAALVPVPASVAAAGTPAMTVSPTSYRTTFAWPHPSGQKATKTFVYTNHSGRALTLKLSIGTAYKGGPTGKGVWSLSRTQLKVPAHHHSSVTLTAYGTGAAAGDYKNHLVAAYGTAKLTTTIDATIAPQPKPSTFTLTVNAIDRTGAHVTPDLTLHQNLSNGSGGGCAGTVSGKSTQTFTVSPGSYNVFAPITSPDGTTTLADTDVTVSKDTTVTLDARQARQLQYAFDGPAAAPVRVQMGFVEPTWAPGPDWRDFCAIEQFGTDPSTYYMLAGPSQAQFLIRTLWQQPGATDVDPTPYYYDLVDTQAGLPANPTFTIHSADLSQVKTTYRNAGSGTSPVTVYTQPYPGGQDFSLAVSQTAPRTVTWYRTPGVKYLQGVKINGLTQTMPYTAYPAGPSTEIWNNALIAPEYEDFGSTAGVDDHGNIWYRGTEFLISPTPGIHSYPRSLPGFSSTLTKDGTAVPLTNSGFTTAAKVSSIPGRYALTVTADHALTDSSLSTQVQAAWNFTLAPVSWGWKALPLLYVRMAPQGLDDSNRAVPGSETTIPLSVDRQPRADAATITNVTLESSTDDGTTWQPLTVTPVAQGWTTTVTNPASAGFVSLRATATDSAGNTVVETITHAYEVGP